MAGIKVLVQSCRNKGYEFLALGRNYFSVTLGKGKRFAGLIEEGRRLTEIGVANSSQSFLNQEQRITVVWA
jgi:hypothetical protein